MIRHQRPTLVVTLHDGFYGCGTGVGYSNHALLQVLVDLLPARGTAGRAPSPP